MAVFLSPEAFVAPSFNHLVVGGGTAGLALAARLSENPQVTVGVLEAGIDRSNDPKLHESNVEAFVKENFASEYHPMGTYAMGPRTKGGVVDERLKFHGTRNLRVVDASIFPLLPRGNLQTLVYAVAERAADFIKEDKKK